VSARAGHRLVFAVVAWSYRWTRYTVNTWHINTLICELFITLREWSIVKVVFCLLQVASRFASTAARSWCSTNLASDATRLPSCLGQRVNQFKLDRSCHVSRRVREQSRDNYVICLSLWYVGTWNELTWRDALLQVWNEKIMHKNKCKNSTLREQSPFVGALASPDTVFEDNYCSLYNVWSSRMRNVKQSVPIYCILTLLIIFLTTSPSSLHRNTVTVRRINPTVHFHFITVSP